MALISKKICMVGDFGVGKTSLIRRFVERQFSDQYLSTVGVKISRKTVEFPKNNSEEVQKVQLLIWDIEGHTKFKAITPAYLQGASGALIVADVSRPETIQSLENHFQLFFSTNPQGFIAVALNKIDLITTEDLQALLETLAIQESRVIAVFQTSAKTGDNVDETFEKLARKILNE